MNRVDIANDIDWHERHILLKAAFPLAASSDDATYEIPYGTIQRPTTRNNSWESAKFEVPAMRWADLGDGKHGFSLINESKYGYDTKGNVMRISLLRSPTSPDPEADQGEHHFSYSLYPHAGDWKQALTVRRGYEFNYKLQAQQVMSHEGTTAAGTLFRGRRCQECSAHCHEEDRGRRWPALALLSSGEGTREMFSCRCRRNAGSAILTNLMEEPSGSPLPITGNKVTVPVHPFEIVSVRVNYSPTQAK